MKIGILTFQRADNYGAMLQCYALQEYLKGAGHEVEVIDYRNYNLEKDHEVKFNASKWVTFLLEGHLRSFVMYFKNLSRGRYRRQLFTQFREKYLSLSDSVSGDRIPTYYDRIIIGSDQMWTIGCYKKYDPIYWGQFPHDSQCKVYGYAISSKADFLMHLSLEQLRLIVNSFDGLSFREQKIADLMECITRKTYPVTADPTLLSKADMWEPLIDERWANRNYVVIYYVRGEVKSIMNDAYTYAKTHHCDVVNLSSKSYSVEDFVSAIKYSKAVFTSSFHATVFSIIFNRPLNSYCLHDGNDDRYSSLLKQLGLESNLIDYGSPYHEPSIREKEYIENRMEDYRKNSLEFINSILKH